MSVHSQQFYLRPATPIRRQAPIGRGVMPQSRILLFLIALVSLSISTSAQTATAVLSGTVTDQSKAVVSHAKITILNPATGTTRASIADEQGRFFVSALLPGTYDLRVEQKG